MKTCYREGKCVSDFNKQIIEEFRANGGKVGGYFANSTLLLLHTTGARSGKERVNPVVTFEDGDRLVIVASKGGAPSHPDWYYNILANPVVGVEYGDEEFQARATITEEPERTELYERMEGELASFSEYKRKAGRVIPVITLSRL
ncbi:MAG: nitroreductase family deazaflavin-dependent oxidoreductase [Chloroflexota bacterium]|jgi:deazaflavin-dependent oxidoreductase (nitroreductase family)